MVNEFDKPKIEASFIIEMMGKPKDHLEETLKRLVEKISTEKGVEIVDKTLHEARKFEIKASEEQKKATEELKEKTKGSGIEVLEDVYTTFAEIDAKFDDLNSLLFVSFNYMPSNIQVTRPENFILRNSDIDSILSGIVLRLHRYDEVAKHLSVEKSLLQDKLKELIGKKKV